MSGDFDRMNGKGMLNTGMGGHGSIRRGDQLSIEQAVAAWEAGEIGSDASRARGLASAAERASIFTRQGKITAQRWADRRARA